MNLKDITLSNIKKFIQGNTRYFGESWGIVKPEIKEQVAWRATHCSDCIEQGKCVYCGCKVPGKWYVNESCNKGKRFPDLMKKDAWERYKKENNIDISL